MIIFNTSIDLIAFFIEFQEALLCQTIIIICIYLHAKYRRKRIYISWVMYIESLTLEWSKIVKNSEFFENLETLIGESETDQEHY